MKKHRWNDIAFGMVLMALLAALTLPVFAYRGSPLQADYADIKLVVNGTPVTPKDAKGRVVEPFALHGTTYLPVRAVGEALGKEVKWDGSTHTVYVGEIPDRAIREVAAGGKILLNSAERKVSTEDIFGEGRCFRIVDLPNTKKAMEEAGASYMVDPYNLIPGTRINIDTRCEVESGGCVVTVWVNEYASQIDEVNVEGYYGEVRSSVYDEEAWNEARAITKGVLLDLVPDADDVQAIIQEEVRIREELDRIAQEDGTEAWREARDRYLEEERELNSVIVKGMSPLKIRLK